MLLKKNPDLQPSVPLPELLHEQIRAQEVRRLERRLAKHPLDGVLLRDALHAVLALGGGRIEGDPLHTAVLHKLADKVPRSRDLTVIA